MEINTYEFIYPSVDWFQGVFQNVDFDFVLHDFLGLGVLPIEDPEVMKSFELRMGYDTQAGFNYNGIIITTNKDKLLSAPVGAELFNYVFSQVQLKISGEGMRFLRSVDPYIESRLYSKRDGYLDELGVASFHITRADFAFDLINYKPSFLLDLISHLNSLYFSEQRSVPVCHAKTRLKYQVHAGDCSTVYVGGTRSNSLLRVYDKLVESKGDFSKLPVELPPDVYVKSWIRVEWQCRKERAHEIYYGTNNWQLRFKALYEYFAFCDEERNVLPFWSELYNWGSVPGIIQNAKWVEPPLTKDRMDETLIKKVRELLPYFAGYRKGNWIEWFVQLVRQQNYILMDPINKQSYATHNFKYKTAIYAGVPAHLAKSEIKHPDIISELPNIRFVDEDGIRKWVLV